jgi:hypothetical protein
VRVQEEFTYNLDQVEGKKEKKIKFEIYCGIHEQKKITLCPDEQSED